MLSSLAWQNGGRLCIGILIDRPEEKITSTVVHVCLYGGMGYIILLPKGSTMAALRLIDLLSGMGFLIFHVSHVKFQVLLWAIAKNTSTFVVWFSLMFLPTRSRPVDS